MRRSAPHVKDENEMKQKLAYRRLKIRSKKVCTM